MYQDLHCIFTQSQIVENVTHRAIFSFDETLFGVEYDFEPSFSLTMEEGEIYLRKVWSLGSASTDVLPDDLDFLVVDLENRHSGLISFLSYESDVPANA